MKEAKKDETLNEQIQTTVKLLAQLKAEQADLNTKRRIAVEDADSASIISLRHRADNLPVEIRATEIRLERLYLKADEESLPELEAQPLKLYPLVEAAQKAYDEAQAARYRALAAHQHSIEVVKEKRSTIGNRRRNIQKLVYESSKN